MFKKLKLFAINTFIIGLIVLVLLEISLHFLPAVVQEPLKSHLEEIKTLKYPPQRLYYPLSDHFGKNPIVSKILLPEVDKSKPVDILLVGDSFVFSDRCHNDSTLSALFSQESQKSVVNVGIRDSNLPTYNRMVEVGMRYTPKKVVYCIFANDWQYKAGTKIDTLKEENIYKKLPTDRFITEEVLNLDYTLSYWRKRVMSQLMLTYVVQFFRFNRDKVEQSLKSHTFDIAANNQTMFYSFGGVDYYQKLLSYDEKSVKEALLLNLAFVQEANRFATSQGASFEVVLFPPKEFVYVNLLPKSEQAKVCNEGMKQTYQVFADSLASHNIPCYDMTKDLQTVAKQGRKLYFSIDGHFNHTGNFEVAKLFATKYKE